MRHFTHFNRYAAVLLAGITFSGCNKDASAPKPVTTATASSTEEMVLTPAGLMPKSHVHFVEPGTELMISNGHITKIQSASGKMLLDFGPATITQDPIHNQFNSLDASVVPAAVNGWAAYTYWSNPATTKPITYFTTNWTVLQTVTAGTALQGIMAETGTNGSNYNYTSSFAGYPAAVNIKISNVPEAYWAAETLEVYSVTKAAQYPNQTSMPFSAIQILQGTANAAISWTPVKAVSGTLPKAVVNSNSSPNGEVTIDF